MSNPFTPEHEMFRKTVKDFALTELKPNRFEWEKAKDYPRELYKKMGDLGFFGIRYPIEYGGSGLDYWYTVCFIEELMHCRMSGLAMDMMVQSEISIPIINELGTEEQKQEFLAPAIRGDKIAALGVTEPCCGSDVAGLKTTARRDGNDYIINGAKTFITNGSRADFITLMVRTGGEGHSGISIILFPTKTPGFSVGRKLNKLGNDSSDTAELHFENCRVPAKNLIGQENKGFYYLMTNFQGERLGAAIMSVQHAQIMIDEAIAYGREREAFGRPIIKFQVWRQKFAEHLTYLTAARRLCYYAASLFNRGQNAVKAISMAKLMATDLANKIAYDCLQFHGGYGYMAEYDISRDFRDVRLITIGGGTSEVMKEIIAKEEGF